MKQLRTKFVLLISGILVVVATNSGYGQNTEEADLSRKEIALIELYANATTAKILGNTEIALEKYRKVVEKNNSIDAA